MSDREQLAEIVYNKASGCDADGNVTTRAAIRTADAIIAAGWRLVPDDAVVVSREDVRIVTSVMDGVPLEPSPKRYADAMDRLYAALKADADA